MGQEFEALDGVPAGNGKTVTNGSGATEFMNTSLKRPMATGAGLNDDETSCADGSTSLSDFVPPEESAGV